ncbi:lipase family protein [Mariniradius sediminis]|uniref:Lipase family protein n=1 Tax=Mariniradius sediminis TaxID=2909237 RepID=A0ABS9C0D0_9BACT|nr:lipase family protein [Mariniradius sediminis]MCF1752901.1 lipase family protein [Mariniradius sediminis]
MRNTPCWNWRRISLLLFLAFYSVNGLRAQGLKPGFSPKEYLELMKVSAKFAQDSLYLSKIPEPEFFEKIYDSPEMGLKNKWQLWFDKDSNTALVSIRGTAGDPSSWLENFYSGMVPAKGQLQIASDFKFDYQLAENTRAAVHTGWLLATAFIARDLGPKMDSLYQAGTKDLLIMGHSQGGGIAYLLTAYLLTNRANGKIPSDWIIKTYCSAAPKPGNLFFAMDYENLTQDGWAYNVINASDWVPQTPFSIQTIADFNKVNPFSDVDQILKKQKFSQRLLFKHVYNKLDKPTRHASRNFEKYLGEKATGIIQKYLPEFEKPTFAGTMDYARAGNTISLTADAAYLEKYPDDPEKIFMHHFHLPYMELVKRRFEIR